MKYEYHIETTCGDVRLQTPRPHTDFATLEDFLKHHRKKIDLPLHRTLLPAEKKRGIEIEIMEVSFLVASFDSVEPYQGFTGGRLMRQLLIDQVDLPHLKPQSEHTYLIQADIGVARLQTQRPHTDFATVEDFLKHHLQAIGAALPHETFDLFEVFLLLQRFDTKTEKHTSLLDRAPLKLEIPF